MKQVIMPAAIVVGLLTSMSSLAATSPSASQLNQEIASVNRQTGALQNEVKNLKVELRRLKANQNKAAKQTSAKKEIVNVKQKPEKYFSASRYLHGVTVTTSPFIGKRSAYGATDLLTMDPSMNEDLRLLRRRQTVQQGLETVGDSLNNRPIVFIGGKLEGQVLYSSGFSGNAGDVNLSTAELDIAPMVSDWANAYFTLDYDSSAPQTGSRVTNSRLFLERGFLTIGNLDVTPLYFTLGQMYVPFGKYSSMMLTTPLTQSLARTLVRAALVGFYKNGFYVSGYGFRGNQTTAGGAIFKQGGANAGYDNSTRIGDIDFGAGYISNIADSQGMQQNALPPLPVTTTTGGITVTNPTQFQGFGESVNGNALVHRVDAADVHSQWSRGPVAIVAEYLSSLERFAPADLRFENHGAQPGAAHVEADYTWHIHDHPVSFGLSYGQTWEALALNLPQQSYTAILTTSIWKNTVEGLEYRHDVNYSQEAASAVGGTGGLGVPNANVGGTRNMVTLQFGVYF